MVDAVLSTRGKKFIDWHDTLKSVLIWRVSDWLSDVTRRKYAMTGRPRWTIPDYSVLLAVIPRGHSQNIEIGLHQGRCSHRFTSRFTRFTLQLNLRWKLLQIQWSDWWDHCKLGVQGEISIANVKLPSHFASVFMPDNCEALPGSIAFFLPTWSTSEEKITAHLETFEEERYWQNTFSELCLDYLTL